MISKAKINYLFEEIWPEMDGRVIHQHNCIKSYDKIERIFVNHKLNFNDLLRALVELNGIGLTIATGLIWCSYPNRAIPFDKYTLSFCIKYQWINSNCISKDYSSVCKKVLKGIKEYQFDDGSPYRVIDMVREAMDEMKYSEWLVKPE
jgi:hypothetical protein